MGDTAGTPCPQVRNLGVCGEGSAPLPRHPRSPSPLCRLLPPSLVPTHPLPTGAPTSRKCKLGRSPLPRSRLGRPSAGAQWDGSPMPRPLPRSPCPRQVHACVFYVLAGPSGDVGLMEAEGRLVSGKGTAGRAHGARFPSPPPFHVNLRPREHPRRRVQAHSFTGSTEPGLPQPGSI